MPTYKIKLPRRSGIRRASLEVEIRERPTCAPHLSTNLEPLEKAIELSICGTIRYTDGGETGGQCFEAVAELWGDDPNVAALIDAWKAHHLCGMNAGTTAQTECIKAHEAAHGPLDRLNWYKAACNVLENAGLLTDRGYKYGTAWLAYSLPAKARTAVEEACRELGA